jgi:hypothetical protein
MIGYSKLQQGTGTGPVGSIKFRFHNIRRKFDKIVWTLCVMWFVSSLHCLPICSPSLLPCSYQGCVTYKTKTPYITYVFFIYKKRVFISSVRPSHMSVT